MNSSSFLLSAINVGKTVLIAECVVAAVLFVALVAIIVKIKFPKKPNDEEKAVPAIPPRPAPKPVPLSKLVPKPMPASKPVPLSKPVPKPMPASKPVPLSKPVPKPMPASKPASAPIPKPVPAPKPATRKITPEYFVKEQTEQKTILTKKQKPVPNMDVKPVFEPVRNPGPEKPRIEAPVFTSLFVGDNYNNLENNEEKGISKGEPAYYPTFARVHAEESAAETDEESVEEVEDDDDGGENEYEETITVGPPENNPFDGIKRRSFIDKFNAADSIVRNNYSVIKNELLSYKKVKSKISNSCDTIRNGRAKLCKIKVTTKNVMVYLALDPDDPEFNDGTMPHDNIGDKKSFMETPFRIKVRSPLSVKRTIKAIGIMAEKKGLKKNPYCFNREYASNPNS